MQLGIQMWKLFLDGSSDRIRERLSERISPCNRKSSPVLQTEPLDASKLSVVVGHQTDPTGHGVCSSEHVHVSDKDVQDNKLPNDPLRFRLDSVVID